MAAQCLQTLDCEMSEELSEGCGSVEEAEECAVVSANAVGMLSFFKAKLSVISLH